VRNLDTLWLPRGTGRIDDIGEIILLDRIEGQGLSRKVAPRIVEDIDLVNSTAEAVEQGFLSDYSRCARIL
jgi:hypothetical protein